jgi:hypothetical protein
LRASRCRETRSNACRHCQDRQPPDR